MSTAKLATLVVNRADQRELHRFQPEKGTCQISTHCLCSRTWDRSDNGNPVLSFSMVCSGNETILDNYCFILCRVGISPFQIGPSSRVPTNSLPRTLLFPISVSVNRVSRIGKASPMTLCFWVKSSCMLWDQTLSRFASDDAFTSLWGNPSD